MLLSVSKAVSKSDMSKIIEFKMVELSIYFLNYWHSFNSIRYIDFYITVYVCWRRWSEHTSLI